RWPKPKRRAKTSSPTHPKAVGPKITQRSQRKSMPALRAECGRTRGSTSLLRLLAYATIVAFSSVWLNCTARQDLSEHAAQQPTLASHEVVLGSLQGFESAVYANDPIL